MDRNFTELASLVDNALDNQDIDSIDGLISHLDKISQDNLEELELAKVAFLKANCFAGIRYSQNSDDLWSWDNAYLEKEIYQLRIARNLLSNIAFEEDGTDLRFRVTTNLANAFSHIGRTSEAIDLWDEVINDYPTFGMAVGNRGHAFFWYAKSLYDPGHQDVFLNESYHQIKQALNLGIEEHAKRDMQNWIEYLLKLNDWENFQFQPEQESRGKSKHERLYRTWCLDNKLFLNPLNDLWKEDISANDIFTLPSIIVKIEDKKDGSPPEIYGTYNQLKQEFVSARYMLFEAIEESKKEIHFSDKKVELYDMLDYREYRLWIEKVKMAFLSIYAIFDKIAYLINDYWQLNLPVKRINFKSCWYKNHKLSPVFKGSTNLPLRGLYWISKEFTGEKGKTNPLQPDAWHIAEIRNHIAHKYLKVFDSFVDAEQLRKSRGHEWEYPINDEELIYQAIKLLKLARSALIYSSLAINYEEIKKKAELGDGLIAEFELFQVDDKYRL